MARLAVSRVYPDSPVGIYSRLDRSLVDSGTDSVADLSGGGNPANFTPVVIWSQFAEAANQVWSFESPC